VESLEVRLLVVFWPLVTDLGYIILRGDSTILGMTTGEWKGERETKRTTRAAVVPARVCVARNASSNVRSAALQAVIPSSA
jgi:hypothetical protein